MGASSRSTSVHPDSTAQKSKEEEETVTAPDRVWMWKVTKVFNQHSQFGDWNLISNKAHFATMWCLEECYLLKLEKEVYVRVIEKAIKRDIQNRLNFLKEFRIFANISQLKL